MKLFIGFLVSLSLLTACSKDKSEKDELRLGSSQNISSETSVAKISIVNEAGAPIAHAKLMLGLKGDIQQADEHGNFNIPATWTGLETLTLSAQGYVRATYIDLPPKAKKIVLRQNQASATRFELSGVTTGFNVKNGDGLVDFGFVMPLLTKQDFLNFDIGLIISPENDTIEAIGKKMPIPSNVTLPKQKESYVLPVNLEKPRYRTFFTSPGEKKVFAGRGQFPFKKVIGDLQSGKEFYELINHFNVLGGTLRDVNISQNSQNSQTLDIPVTEMNFNQKRTLVNAPVGSDEVLIGASLNEVAGGYMYPADMKHLKANAKEQLNIGPTGNSYILSVLKRKSETKPGSPGLDRISAVAVPFTEGVTPRHLPLMENPRVASRQVVQVEKINPVAGVQMLATYAALSTVQRTVVDQETIEEVQVQWEVFAPKWVASVEIPQWPGEEVAPEGSMRWSVALLGTTQNVVDIDLGPSVVQAVTHVTNASADY